MSWTRRCRQPPPARATRERSRGAPLSGISSFPLSSRDFPRDLFSTYLYGSTSRSGRTEEPTDRGRATDGSARGLPHGLRDAVDHDGQQQDAETGDQSRAEVVRDTVDDLVAEALSTDQPGDDHDR